MKVETMETALVLAVANEKIAVTVVMTTTKARQIEVAMMEVVETSLEEIDGGMLIGTGCHMVSPQRAIEFSRWCLGESPPRTFIEMG
ncbi:hypothetical protein D3C87_1023410 [compost metagenome]